MNFIDKRKYDWKSSIPSTRKDKFLSIIICKRKEQKWNNRATDAQLIGWYSKEILLLNVEFFLPKTICYKFLPVMLIRQFLIVFGIHHSTSRRILESLQMVTTV
ncbi:hypothetical protein T02_11801 [Trichinella nativa]|uniref:Uncharacterized protein n=1 Tax=Trichinella nativa TaxID=6335 RepID=A0A0V1L6K1_9BILA|nr:hypothetical protein T02_11801 [Trichinella nativa]